MADSSVEQAKKQIVAALQKLRSILIESPEQEYPGGLREHPWLMQEWPTIKRALCEAGMEPGHPGPRNLAFHVGDFLYTAILPWTRLPLRRRDREVLDTIDDYIEAFGGQTENDGPSTELGVLWWEGQRYDLEIEPAAWKLLKVLWGKHSMDVAEVAKRLKKPPGTTYNSLKPALSRLNNAVARAHLRFLPFTWSKKRGENIIICTPPPVSDKFQG